MEGVKRQSSVKKFNLIFWLPGNQDSFWPVEGEWENVLIIKQSLVGQPGTERASLPQPWAGRAPEEREETGRGVDSSFVWPSSTLPVSRNLGAVLLQSCCCLLLGLWKKSRVATPRNSLPALGWRLSEPGSNPRLLLSGADHRAYLKELGFQKTAWFRVTGHTHSVITVSALLQHFLGSRQPKQAAFPWTHPLLYTEDLFSQPQPTESLELLYRLQLAPACKQQLSVLSMMSCPVPLAAEMCLPWDSGNLKGLDTIQLE